MKKIILLAIILLTTKCGIVSSNQINFFDVINNSALDAVINNYLSEMSLHFKSDNILVAVFVQEVDADKYKVQMIKIDSLNKSLSPLLKMCKIKQRGILFYLSNDSKIKSINSCFSKEIINSNFIRDYYPVEVILMDNKILSTNIVSLDSLQKWYNIIKIEHQPFVPPQMTPSK